MGIQDEPVGRTPFAYEPVTVTDAAIGLTPATYLNAIRAEMTLESGQIRIRGDGTAPTATEGRIVEIGDQLVLNSSAQIKKAKFIRTGGTSGTLRVEYFH